MNAEAHIIQTYQNYNIIGLGEGGHGLENFHEFLRKMFENKKIQETIDIVIVEFANTAYQDVLDRYILGEEINIDDLQMIWRESTSPARLGELPIYFQLLKKIRDINIPLPQHKKIRVLGGDPAIDWKKINTLEDYKHQIGCKKETYPADIAINFGVDQMKKVLIIYSEIHLTKIGRNILGSYYPSITSTVNTTYPNAMKSIGTIYSQSFLAENQLMNLPINSIIDLADNKLGNVAADKFFQASLFKDGKEVQLFEGYKINELFDALLYVGKFDSLKRCAMPKPDFDNAYWDELNRRRKIVGLNVIPKP